MRQGSSTREARLLTLMQTNCRALAGGLTLALPNRHQSCVSGGIDTKAVLARFRYGECLVWSVDLIDFASVEFAEVHVQSALVYLYLHGIISDIGQSQTGFRTRP